MATQAETKPGNGHRVDLKGVQPQNKSRLLRTVESGVVNFDILDGKAPQTPTHTANEIPPATPISPADILTMPIAETSFEYAFQKAPAYKILAALNTEGAALAPSVKAGLEQKYGAGRRWDTQDLKQSVRPDTRWDKKARRLPVLGVFGISRPKPNTEQTIRRAMKNPLSMGTILADVLVDNAIPTEYQHLLTDREGAAISRGNVAAEIAMDIIAHSEGTKRATKKAIGIVLKQVDQSTIQLPSRSAQVVDALRKIR